MLFDKYGNSLDILLNLFFGGEMKVTRYEIKEIENKEGKEVSYSLELKIIFCNKKDRDEFLRIVKDSLR